VPYKILDPDKGSWLVQIQRDGVRWTRGRKTGGEKAAKKAEEKLLAELERHLEVRKAAKVLGVAPPSGASSSDDLLPPKLSDYFVKRWPAHAMVVQNDHTRQKSEAPIKYVLFYLGDRRLNELLEPSVINEFVEKMKTNGPISFATKRDGKARKTWAWSRELSNATINRSLQRLRAVLYLAYREKRIPAAPKIELLPEDDSEAVIPPTEDQFKLLLKAAKKFVDVAPLMPEVIEFDAETGLRESELLCLTFNSVDRARRCIRIEKQPKIRFVNGKPWKPKYCKWREVPLSARALDIVDRRIATGPTGPHDLVFTNVGGAPYMRLAMAPKGSGKGFFPDVVEDAGLKGNVTFHSLRHLFAVRLLTRGVPIAVVSELLGHSDINMTVKRYGRFSSDAKVKWDAVSVLDTPNDDENQPTP
jgi:integrase